MSTAKPPQDSQAVELDWIHLQETITMLAVAVAQLEVSLADGEHSVNRLTGSLTRVLDTLPNVDPGLASASLQSSIGELHSDVKLIVTEFQFYDRMAQRLSHIKESLSALGDLFGSPTRLNQPDTWKQLQNDLKSRYTMECEREMFELILKGASVQEALDHFRQHYLQELNARGSADEGDIDLF